MLDRSRMIQNTILHHLVDAGHDVNGVMDLMQQNTVEELEGHWEFILSKLKQEPKHQHLFNIWDDGTYHPSKPPKLKAA